MASPFSVDQGFVQNMIRQQKLVPTGPVRKGGTAVSGNFYGAPGWKQGDPYWSFNQYTYGQDAPGIGSLNTSSGYLQSGRMAQPDWQYNPGGPGGGFGGGGAGAGAGSGAGGGMPTVQSGIQPTTVYPDPVVQRQINQMRADVPAGPEWYMKQFTQPGVSRSAGTLSAAMPAMIQARMGAEDAVQNLRLGARAEDQAHLLAGQYAQGQDALRQAMLMTELQGMQQRTARAKQRSAIDVLQDYLMNF